MDPNNSGKFKVEVKGEMKLKTTKKPRKPRYADAVFNNPLLLDKIINYCIYESDEEEISTKGVLASRLVTKIWLQSVTRVLQKSCESFINLSCENGDIVLKGNVPQIVGNEFISLFSNESRLEYSVLPLKLELNPPFFYKGDYHILDSLFQNCGDILSKLSVHYARNVRESTGFKFGQLNLPSLKNLTFKFGGFYCEPGKIIWLGHNESKLIGWEFLQQLLNGAPNLKIFTLTQSDKEQILESKSNSLQLPESITKINLEGSLTIKEFELLSRNRLVHLETINLVVHERKPEVKIILKILTRFQQQLKKLSLKMFAFRWGAGFVQFPGVMINLRSFSLSRYCFKVVPEKRQYFSELAPNLTELSINEVTEEEFLEWIGGPSFANVRTLEISLVTLAQNGISRHDSSVNERVLSSIKTSFPNVQDLTLKYDICDIFSLKYLFRNFGRLKKLRLNFDGKPNAMTGLNFVSNLLGVSAEDIHLISETRDLKIAADNSESIINLKELTSLTICIQIDRYAYPSLLHPDFFQVNLCKKYGFDNMPRLKVFKLIGGYSGHVYGFEMFCVQQILKDLNEECKYRANGPKLRHYRCYYLK